MNVTKARQKGFFVLLLAAVIILGMPGMNVLAATYNFVDLNPNDVLHQGDTVVFPLAVKSCGNIITIYGENNNRLDHDTKYTGDPQYVFTVPSGDWSVSNAVYDTSDSWSDSSDLYLVPYDPSSSNSSVSSSSSGNSFAARYHRSLKDLIVSIKQQGGVVHGYGAGTSLPYAVMKALEDNPEDTLVFTCEYKNYRYTFTILGADVKGKITPEIPWYGPYWLAQNFFETTEIECLIPETEAK